MNRFLFLCVLVMCVLTAHAQRGDSKRSLTEVHHRLGVSSMHINDPYLSILEYSGLGFRYDFTASKFLNPERAKVSQIARLTGLGGLTLNPPSTARIMYMGGTASWGLQYHIRPIEEILLRAGANLEALYGYKQNTRNVNNPINMDIAANINATLSAKFLIHTRKRTITFNADLEVPMVGVMAVLPPGMTYWELSKSQDYFSVVHPTSIGNRQGFRGTYWFDIPLRYSTWSIGARNNTLKYIANDHLYSFLEYGVFVGVTYEFIRFSGRRNLAPHFFVSPKF